MKRLAVLLALGFALASPVLAQPKPGGAAPAPQEEVNYYMTAPTVLITMANAGDIAAAFELGERYTFGEGSVDVDYNEAIRWYRLAADQGHIPAQMRIGEAYRYGDGVKQSFSEAMRFLRLAADTGFAPAQYQVALMYLGDTGFDRDLNEYRHWLELGAAQNHIRSMEALADLLVDPQVGPVDYAQALQLYGFAAERGDGNAQFDLGIMYAEGEGVPVDNAEAYYWISLSILDDPRETRQNVLNEVAAGLSAKQIEALDLRVAAFEPLPAPTFF
jgi:TPR repeat protein